MFIPLVLSTSLILALARGGRLTTLTSLPVRGMWLFFIPLLLQLVIFTPLASALSLSGDLIRLVHLASLLLAALALVLNRHLPGMIWIAAGLTLNLVVISLNGGLMPVSAEARTIAGMIPLAGDYNNVTPMTTHTVVWFFGDVLPLPAWVPFHNVFSLGDVLITLGGVLFTQKALLPTGPARMEPTRL